VYVTREMISEKDEARLWAKVDRKSSDECWLWTAKARVHNRGRICVAGKEVFATHVALALDGRPRPQWLFACHTCDNPPCVNPAHLWWGTKKENAQDASQKKRLPLAQRTHCSNGHEFSPENTWISKVGARVCRTCSRRSKRAWNAKPDVRKRKNEARRKDPARLAAALEEKP